MSIGQISLKLESKKITAIFTMLLNYIASKNIVNSFTTEPYVEGLFFSLSGHIHFNLDFGVSLKNGLEERTLTIHLSIAKKELLMWSKDP